MVSPKWFPSSPSLMNHLHRMTACKPSGI